MADIVERLGAVGLWGEAREEILRLRAEVVSSNGAIQHYVARVNQERERTEKAEAESDRLHSAGYDMAQQIDALQSQNTRLRAELAATRNVLRDLLGASEKHIFGDECQAERDAAHAALKEKP